MRKTSLLIVTFLTIFMADSYAFSTEKRGTDSAEIAVKRGKRKKNGRYKKKKGFLKRKNDCDCPKH